MQALAILLLVIGGFVLGSAALFKKDVTSTMFGKRTLLTNGLFLLIAVAAICIGFSRDNYLPFLGPTVLPCSLMNTQTPMGADYKVEVPAVPGSKILYWAAEPANRGLQFEQNWEQAYRDYTNAGVAIADDRGLAVLRIRKPQPYNVPMRGELSPHVHYRVCGKGAMIGRIQTVTLDSKEYFENVVSAQETQEEVANPPPAPLPPAPASAVHELNRIAAETSAHSRMAESGAFDEFRPMEGAYLEYAFTGKGV